MASYADSKYAARWEAAFGKKIRRLYGQAQKEVEEKLEDFTKKHQERDAMMREKLDKGQITEAEYMQWLQGQVFMSGRWRQKVVEITKVYVNADKKAREMVRDAEYSEFTSASNFQAWDIEKNTRGAVSFDLYDDRAVTRLIRDNPQMLPKWKINEKKDYVWNERRLRNSVTQAIIQGEGIDKLAKRLSTDLSTSNRQHMVMFARTAVTGAQNEGSLQRMRDAEDLGLKVQKRWLATLDSRTRDSHADLDGQTVDVDEPFVTKDGTKIMCPGDPSAPPEEVCNCRCTMITVYPQYENLFSAGERRAKEEVTDDQGKTKTTEKVIPYQTYSQWAAAKKSEKKEDDRNQTAKASTIVQGKDISTTWVRRPEEFKFEIKDVINDQGFDGKPQVVSREKFEKAVKAANGGKGFIAQRVYSAGDPETLEAYKEMLYNGEWYVECTTGGAQYGQGMYCAADYNGELTDGIKAEMGHYIDQYKGLAGRNFTEEDRLNHLYDVAKREHLTKDETTYLIQSSNLMRTANIRFKDMVDPDDINQNIRVRIEKELGAEIINYEPETPYYIETFTLDPSAKIVTFREINDIRNGNLDMSYRAKEIERIVASQGFTRDEATFVKYNLGAGVSWGEVDAAARRLTPQRREELVGKFYEIGEEATKRYNDEHERRISLARMYQGKYHDIGSLAAALGYDAINAEGHGESGSYTVILNRTKVIFLGE